jgi:hypothetical protein
MDDDKQLQFLVLSWIDSRTLIEVELLMSAEHGMSPWFYILVCMLPLLKINV